MIPRHVKYICDCRSFSDINVSQGSAATHMKYGWIFNKYFAENLLENLTVKKRKTVENYHQEFGVSFFGTHCIFSLVNYTSFVALCAKFYTSPTWILHNTYRASYDRCRAMLSAYVRLSVSLSGLSHVKIPSVGMSGRLPAGHDSVPSKYMSMWRGLSAMLPKGPCHVAASRLCDHSDAVLCCHYCSNLFYDYINISQSSCSNHSLEHVQQERW